MFKGQQVVDFNNEKFIVIASFKEPETEILDRIKLKYLFDTMLRKDGIMYLCQKIDDAEILEELTWDENIINQKVIDFLQKKEIKKIEEVDNYLIEINSESVLKYDEEILRKLLLEKLTGEINAQ